MQLLDQYQTAICQSPTLPRGADAKAKQWAEWRADERLANMGAAIVDMWASLFNTDPVAALSDEILTKLIFLYDALTWQLDRLLPRHVIELRRISSTLCTAYGWLAEMARSRVSTGIDLDTFCNLAILLERRYWQLINTELSGENGAELERIALALGKTYRKEHCNLQTGKVAAGWAPPAVKDAPPRPFWADVIESPSPYTRKKPATKSKSTKHPNEQIYQPAERAGLF